MKILITGATGFIGAHLCAYLQERGHELVVLTRNPQGAQDRLGRLPAIVGCDLTREEPPLSCVEGVDAVVHLAGETVAQRWSERQKDTILSSRVMGTRHLVWAINRIKQRPKALICASALGFYGDRGNEELDEESTPGTDFLASVCQAWEKEANLAQTRVVNLRIGLVLGNDGGALPKMLVPFKFGLGGVLGSGLQVVSWVHIQELVHIMGFVLMHENVHGPVNAVSPLPVTNAEFTKILAHTLKKPAFLPAPAFALKLILGEMAQIMLSSQRALPAVLQKNSYSFLFPTLDGALKNLLG